MAKYILLYRHRNQQTNGSTVAPAPGAAWYAWESGGSGDDNLLATSLSDPYAAFEIHINSDVALALQQSYYATQNRTFLSQIAAPIVFATCRYWADRVERCSCNPDQAEEPCFCINGVMGPDEANYPVNNSAFTNAAAASNLQWGAEVYRILHGEGTQSGEGAAALGVQDAEVDHWVEIASGMAMPFHRDHQDPSASYTPEYEGYQICSNLSHCRLLFAEVQRIIYPLRREDMLLRNGRRGSNIALGQGVTQGMVARNDVKFYENVTRGNAMGSYTGNMPFFILHHQCSELMESTMRRVHDSVHFAGTKNATVHTHFNLAPVARVPRGNSQMRSAGFGNFEISAGGLSQPGTKATTTTRAFSTARHRYNHNQTVSVEREFQHPLCSF
jgi:hypothetical protein